MILMWKPPGAASMIGSVVIPSQMAQGLMTKDQYLNLLENRIARMAAKASRDDLQMLELASAEGLDLEGRAPDEVADILIRDSEALAIALDLSDVEWPVAGKRSSREESGRINKADLGTFLSVLYPRQD